MLPQRNEYPRPQMRREEWLPLNGEWEFEFDDTDNGTARGLPEGRTPLSMKINVPFTYQYEASGIGVREYHKVLWYRKSFTLTQAPGKKNALLCFNGVDYKCDVWLNGVHVLSHEGGFCPFHADISGLLRQENVIVVRCEDSIDPDVPRGKQSWKDEPFGCWYVPNSGIWQSVWAEFFAGDCLEAYSLTPDIDKCSFGGELTTLNGLADRIRLTVSYKGKRIKTQDVSADGKNTRYDVCLMELDFVDESFWWTPETPNLMELEISLFKGEELLDRVYTRFGMRKIGIDSNGRICLNNRPYYQRLALDQGYFAESGLTPPSAEALKQDIVLAKQMGFNGARKHQKFEDPYFYYYAEELGFLTWCEMPSAYRFNADEQLRLMDEWQRIVLQARNFTSVVCYVPLNESWGVRKILNDKKQQDFARSLYYITKSYDGSRLVSTNDGWENIDATDIISVHDYAFSGDGFAEKYTPDTIEKVCQPSRKILAEGSKYGGQPILLTEFGGIAMSRDAVNGNWGYNCAAADNEEYYSRYENLIRGISDSCFQGFCLTQLTDVQQEINGLLDKNHRPKFDVGRIKAITQNTGK